MSGLGWLVLGVGVGVGLVRLIEGGLRGYVKAHYDDLLNERLDQTAVTHYLQLEAVRRGIDIPAADENAWQLLRAMRAAAPQADRVLKLHGTRTVKAGQ